MKGRFGPGGHYRYQNSGHDETRTYARAHSYARALVHARALKRHGTRTHAREFDANAIVPHAEALIKYATSLLVHYHIGNRGACLRASHVCDVNVLNTSTFTSISVIFRCIYAMTSLRKIYGASLEHHVCTLVTLVHL